MKINKLKALFLLMSWHISVLPSHAMNQGQNLPLTPATDRFPEPLSNAEPGFPNQTLTTVYTAVADMMEGKAEILAQFAGDRDVKPKSKADFEKFSKSLKDSTAGFINLLKEQQPQIPQAPAASATMQQQVHNVSRAPATRSTSSVTIPQAPAASATMQQQVDNVSRAPATRSTSSVTIPQAPTASATFR
jgi:hypothetical protein